MAQRRVEGRHRLVGEHQLGLLHQRPGDGHALLLAAGERVGAALVASFEADALEESQCLLALGSEKRRKQLRSPGGRASPTARW